MREAAGIMGIHRRTFERRYLCPDCECTRAHYARAFRVRKEAGGTTVSRAEVERRHALKTTPRRGALSGAPFAVRHAAHRPTRTWAAALAPVTLEEYRPGQAAVRALDDAVGKAAGSVGAKARARTRASHAPPAQLPLAL